MSEYMQQHFEAPQCCPYCGEQPPEGGTIEIDHRTAQQSVRCSHCDGHWIDIYHLSAVVDHHDQLHTPAPGGATETPGQSTPDRDLRQRDLVPPEKLKELTVTVVGVGAIGRQLAIQLASMGVRRLQLVDPDTVEAVNLAPQGYFEADLGRPKVEATAALCKQMNPAVMIDTHCARFRRSQTTSDVVFMAVDRIDTRRLIWDTVKDNARFVADGRMSGETLRILTVADEIGRDHYPTTLFEQNEAHGGPCTGRSTLHAATIAAGLMTSQFAKWLRAIDVDADLMLNLLASEMSTGVCDC
jgi:sulfur carrier protein ThiS adenylyltransferase